MRFPPMQVCGIGCNIDTQDRLDKQDEKLLHRELIGSIIECAFDENLSAPSGPCRGPDSSLFQPLGGIPSGDFIILPP